MNTIWPNPLGGTLGSARESCNLWGPFSNLYDASADPDFTAFPVYYCRRPGPLV